MRRLTLRGHCALAYGIVIGMVGGRLPTFSRSYYLIPASVVGLVNIGDIVEFCIVVDNVS